ncbi:MAG: hypothetical protein JSS72_04525 [Armatimonadetes bacterium]|nr:hypothetical protein [Armatimonadota bacterium]
MPICNWCGIESKNDVTCDWCKRPLSLQPSMGPADQRSWKSDASQLNSDSEPTESWWSPTKIALVAVFLVGIPTFFWLSSSDSSKTPQVAESTAPKLPLDQKVVAANAPAPVPGFQSAPPVFLPPPANPSPSDTTFPSLRYATPLGGGGGHARQFVSYEGHVVLSNPADVGLGTAKLRMWKGPDGIMRCVGEATLYNNSDKPVTDYRLMFIYGDMTYAVKPFEGSVQDPRTVYSRVVRQHSELKTPILVEGFHPSGNRITGQLRFEAYLKDEAVPTVDTMGVH